MPKYSIIVPCYNGMPYVKSCVDSIINQNYTDYELIVSEDHSVDGTSEYIDSLKGIPNVKVLHCPQRMSMSEHWEWALSHASGEWQMFVGQDDGLQNYFFELVDKLIKICDRKKIDVIMSERAYFFWPGCEETYGNVKISYSVQDYYKILKTKKEIKRCLWKDSLSYMDFPSMYTTSLFRGSFIDLVRNKQQGVLFTTHPQDANLAAIVSVFANKYIKSYIPLGWVGSSVKSAGLAISLLNKKNELGGEYLKTVNNSNLKRHPLSAPFELSSFCLYYWSALLTVSQEYNKKLYKCIISKNVKRKIFSLAYHDVNSANNKYFSELLKTNYIKMSELKIQTKVKKELKPTLINRVVNKIIFLVTNKLKSLKPGKLNFCENWYYQCNQGDSDLDLFSASKFIESRLKRK